MINPPADGHRDENTIKSPAPCIVTGLGVLYNPKRPNHRRTAQDMLTQQRQTNCFRKVIIIGWLLLLGLCPGTRVMAQEGWPDEAGCKAILSQLDTDPALSGWCLSILPQKGNCIACHTFNVSPWPETLPGAGNIAPPLVAMAPRFPDQLALRNLIEDATTINSHTTMPPYLKHGILTPGEIDQILQFLLKI